MDARDQFQIEVGPLHFEAGTSPSPYDRLLGIQAPLRISVFGREWFNEPAFPVVELAAAVNAWLRRGGDLEFNTMEAEESPFLAVRRMGIDCRIEAAWQAFRVDEPLAFDRVREVLVQFARGVAASTKEQLHIDVDDLLNRRRR